MFLSLYSMLEQWTVEPPPSCHLVRSPELSTTLNVQVCIPYTGFLLGYTTVTVKLGFMV